MPSALLIRLRPCGPWRYGPGDGALDRVDTLYRSDRLFSAVTLAMRQLGRLTDWLDATAAVPEPAVTFSSLFPFQGDALFAAPPATLWPPPAGLVSAPNPVFLAKIRWKTAHFVPLTVVDALLTGSRLLAEQWFPDPESGCLLRRDRPSISPFRTVLRKSAPVDRLSRTSPQAPSIACTEFEPSSGLWTVARFRGDASQEAWLEPVKAAFRLLADTGFGGRRTSGWGQTHAPEFQAGRWPALLLPKTGRLMETISTASAGAETSLFWLLSVYSPAPTDRVDWSAGEYHLTTRGGHTENGSGSGQQKKIVQMLAEGSVIAARGEPSGKAIDVAPDGFAHPVYRSGLALALALPATSGQTSEDQASELKTVEEPAAEEAVTPPCEDPKIEKPTSETPAAPEPPMPPEREAHTPEHPPETNDSGFQTEPLPICQTVTEQDPTEQDPTDPAVIEPAPEEDGHAL